MIRGFFIVFLGMLSKILTDKPTKLFVILCTFFVANALIAECIGGKLFSLEKVFGLIPKPFNFLGEKGLTITLTCGVLLWPIEFVMTDIVNEYFGPKAVRRISFIAIGLISYAFIMFYLAMAIPADTNFWTGSQKANGIDNMQTAFESIFGQGMWIIIGSLVAFMVSQLIDVYVFHKIKEKTGEKWVWLRATGSTVVSQLVDSFVVLVIAFKIGNNWTWSFVIAVCIVNYMYKFSMALLLTPVISIVEKQIEKYLGHETAAKMKLAAMGKSNEL